MILAPHSDRPEAFHREIIYTGFEGNPRFSGGIEMQLIGRISKQFISAWRSGKIAVIATKSK
jgi:hypothetical protein